MDLHTRVFMDGFRCKMLVFYFIFMFGSEVIKEKGLEHVTVEDLVTEVTPKGRGTAPFLYTWHKKGGI